MLKYIFRKKEKGLSTLIGVFFAIFFLLLLFYYNYYMQAIKTLKINLRDDADSSTMAAVTIDLDTYGKDRKTLRCVKSANFNTAMVSTAERVEVLDHFKEYARSLINTVGISDTTDDKLSFSGGNVGWAASRLGAKNFNLEEFKIYECNKTSGKWICYEVYTSAGVHTLGPHLINNAKNGIYDGLYVDKTILSEDGADGIKEQLSELIKDKTQPIPDDIKVPTVKATFSFELNLPKIMLDSHPDGHGGKVSDLKIKSISQTKLR